MAFVNTKKENGVLQVTLSRPERMNAFDPVMIQEITDIFAGVAKQTDLRAVLLEGQGKSFCAGADLEYMKSMAKYSKAENILDSERLFKMFESVRNAPVPVIGLVHGSVFGGGVGLVAACDLVIAEKSAQFCFSEVRLGLIPAVISSFVLSKMNIGFARAMMVTGLVFSADQAVSAGLVHFAGDAKQCQGWAEDALKQLRTNGPEAMRKTKELCDHLSPLKISEHMKHTTRAIAEQRASIEGQEGIGAFLEKRKPSWQKATS